MEDERVKQLAETLRKQGLAASMYEAMEKAKSILNVKSQNNEGKRETTREILKPEENSDIDSEQKEFADTDNPLAEENQFSNLDYDITKETASLNELMQEIGITPEQVAEQEKQKIEQIKAEVNEIKEGLIEAGQNPEKTEEAMEGIAHVNEEVNEIIEERDESPEMQPEQSQDMGQDPGQKQEEPQYAEEKNENRRNEGRLEDKNKIDLTKVFNYKK